MSQNLREAVVGESEARIEFDRGVKRLGRPVLVALVRQCGPQAVAGGAGQRVEIDRCATDGVWLVEVFLCFATMKTSQHRGWFSSNAT